MSTSGGDGVQSTIRKLDNIVGIRLLPMTGRENVVQGSDVVNLGDVYLNGLSVLKLLQVVNFQDKPLRLTYHVENRKPFTSSDWSFQCENENLNNMAASSDQNFKTGRRLARFKSPAALCALPIEYCYLEEGFNELFNHINPTTTMELGPFESKQLVFSYRAQVDETKELSADLRSFHYMKARMIFAVDQLDETLHIPIVGAVCRTVLRLDPEELRFDDCVPGGSYAKDFAVWNRSEIPLLFSLTCPSTAFQDTESLLSCTDYDTGENIIGDAIQVPAYSHTRIQIVFRPQKIGEQTYRIGIENLHDNSDIQELHIYTNTTQELHRDGLLIREANGTLLGGSNSTTALEFGDCFTGIRVSRELHIKNMTESYLHVELSSDRPSEVGFELKMHRDMVQNWNRDSTHFNKMDLYPKNSLERSISTSIDVIEEKEPAKQHHDSDDEDAFEEIDSDQPTRVRTPDPHRDEDDESIVAEDEADDEFEFDTGELKVSEPPTSATSDDPLPNEEQDVIEIETPPDTSSNYLVEILKLPPGVESQVLVWYCPSKSSEKVGKLSKQSCRLTFTCYQLLGSWHQGQKRVLDRTLGKSIQAKAQVCTSIVTVSPCTLIMGDCNIGEPKSMVCKLTNLSELATTVEPCVTSKVLSCIPSHRISLQPKQSRDLRIEIIPRKHNPNYSREITIVNEKNPSNIPSVIVKASNIDTHNVIYHSLFYRMKMGSKFGYFKLDSSVVNCPDMRLFTLTNITNQPVPMTIQSSNSRVKVYILNEEVTSSFRWNAKATRPSLPKQSFKTDQHAHFDRRKVLRRRYSFSDYLSKRQTTAAEDQVKVKRPKPLPSSSSTQDLSIYDKPTDLGRRIIELAEAATILGVGSDDLWDRVNGRLIELNDLISEGKLIPLETKMNRIVLKPRLEFPVVFVFTPLSDGTVNETEKSRIEKYKLYLTLDPNCTRELLVKARVFKSVLTVNQKNINFGRVSVSALNSKVLTVVNVSRIPLFYLVSKTGSIASNFLRVTDGQYGVIPPFDSKDIRFEFQPTLAGPFEEKLHFVNIQDRTNSVSVIIKAKVVKPETFSTSDEVLDFGSCMLEDYSSKRHVILRNNTRQKRRYAIQLAPAAVDSPMTEHIFKVTLESSETLKPMERLKLEEEMEKCEHKLRIAQTKNKVEKVNKLQKKIQTMKDLLHQNESTDLVERDDMENIIRLSRDLPENSVLYCDIPSEGSIRVVFCLKVMANMSKATAVIDGTGEFWIFEAKNEDVIKKLQYTIRSTPIRRTRVYSGRLDQSNLFDVDTKGQTLVFRDDQPTWCFSIRAKSRLQQRIMINIQWKGTTLFQSKVQFQVKCTPPDQLIQGFDTPTGLPIRLHLDPMETLHLELSWKIPDQADLTLREYCDKFQFKDPGCLLFQPISSNTLDTVGAIMSYPIQFEHAEQHYLYVTPNTFDMGTQPCGTTSRVAIYVENRSLQTIEFVVIRIEDPRTSSPQGLTSTPNSITFDRMTGTVESGEETCLQVEFTVNFPGRHRDKIIIRNIHDPRDVETIWISSCGIRPVYVRLPELDPARTGKLQTLDFGPCYIDSEVEYSSVRRLELQSQVQDTIVLTAQSNLKTQCYVFQDRGLTQEAVDIELKGHKSIQLYIALKPRTAAPVGECRELVGGIRVTLRRMEDTLAIFTIKFTGLVGVSVAQVAPKLIDLGRHGLDRSIQHSSQVTITNVSKELPLEFSVAVIDCPVALPTEDQSKMQVTVAHEARMIQGGRNQKLMVYAIAQAVGLYRKRLVIQNLHNKTQTLYVDVQLFIESHEIQAVHSLSIPAIPIIPVDSLYRSYLSDTIKSDLRLVNTSRKMQRLYMKSTLPLQLDQSNLEYDTSMDCYTSQDTIELEADEAMELSVAFQHFASLPEFTPTSLVHPFTGYLSFHNTQQTIQVVRVDGTFCEPRLAVQATHVSLGTIGYINGWKPSEIELELENVSDLPVHFKFDQLVEGLSVVSVSSAESYDYQPLTKLAELAYQRVNGLACWSLEAKQTAQLVLSYHPTDKTEEGPVEFDISILNLSNPTNRLKIRVDCTIIRKFIDITMVSNTFESNIIIPPLPEAKPNWIDCSLYNCYSEELEIRVSTKVEVGFLQLLVQSGSSKSSLSTFRLGPGDSIDLRILCYVESNAKFPSNVPKMSASQVATLLIEMTEHTDVLWKTEQVSLFGCLVPGITFHVSASMVHFYVRSSKGTQEYELCTSRESFWIRNPSNTQSLEYTIDSKPLYQKGLRLTHPSFGELHEEILPAVDPSTGEIEPGESQKIYVTLDQCFDTGRRRLSWNCDEEDEATNESELVVTDTRSNESLRVSVRLVIQKVEPYTASSPIKGPTTDATLTLRGCTPVQPLSSIETTCRFIVDVGQYTVRSGAQVEWEITIENPTLSSPIDYRLYLVQERCREWIRLSRDHGTLDYTQSCHTITLSFSRDQIGFFSTFLVLENVGNPMDLKLIRVQVEIIADINSLRTLCLDKETNTPFQILTAQEGRILYGRVYFGILYRTQSIVIVNSSSMKLEFCLSSNVDASELKFSLDSPILNQINRIVINPRSQVSVFLFYHPQSDATVEIYISCRLVKDFRQRIVLEATKCDPAVTIQVEKCHHLDLLLDFYQHDTTEAQSVLISSIAGADLVIRNDTKFFLVDETHLTLAADDTKRLDVRPNVEALASHREQDVEEHFTIYNQNQYREKYYIRVRFTTRPRCMSIPARPLGIYSLSMLEEVICRFLKAFQTLWAQTESDKVNEGRLQGLFSDFCYITDELIWYGVHASICKATFTQADLIYGVVFGHEAFSEWMILSPRNIWLLKPWIAQLNYFLDCFPGQEVDELQALHSLYQRIRPS